MEGFLQTTPLENFIAMLAFLQPIVMLVQLGFSIWRWKKTNSSIKDRIVIYWSLMAGYVFCILVIWATWSPGAFFFVIPAYFSYWAICIYYCLAIAIADNWRKPVEHVNIIENKA